MKRISVKGYKAINNEKELDLAPINLLIGPNGCGKSTFINSLVLAKGMFKINNDTYAPKQDDKKKKELYNKFCYAYKFSDRLINPFHNLGKFNSNVINDNNKKREFSFSLPIELSYFSDKFNINLHYYLEENNNALLCGVRIINLKTKKELFSLQSEDLEEIARKKDDGNNKNSWFTFNTTLKIDVEYLLHFLNELKKKNTNLTNPLEPFIIHRKEDDSIHEEDKNNSSKVQRDFYKKLTKGDFNKTKKCPLSDNTNERIDNIQDSYLFDYYKDIESQNYFNYHSTDKNKEIINIKEDIEIYEIAMEHEKNWINLLKTGGTVTWAGKDVASIMDFFSYDDLELSLAPLTLSYIQKNDNTDINADDILKKINIFRIFSKKTDFIFNQLLLKNIFNGLHKVNIEINDIIYIPPQRAKFNKSQNIALDQDITTTITKRLNKIKFQEKFDEPIEHFIKYWLAELNLEKKMKFETIDDLINLYSFSENDIKNINRDLGYGINQLFPLICLLSLYNEKYEVYKNDLLMYDSYIKQNGLGNCFLIEEPEANLHPKYQSKLADIFIDASWKFNHQFIIETHSEYMVRKFQYWVAKGKIKPSDINIYYFENKNDDPLIKDLIIKKIEINLDGSLSESFGEGFFDEADKIALELFLLKKHQNN